MDKCLATKIIIVAGKKKEKKVGPDALLRTAINAPESHGKR